MISQRETFSAVKSRKCLRRHQIRLVWLKEKHLNIQPVQLLKLNQVSVDLRGQYSSFFIAQVWKFFLLYQRQIDT